jgi:hypothetical protein
MNNFTRLALGLSFLTGTLLTSCTKDSSSTPTDLTRSSLTGTWMVTETAKKITYEVTIAVDSSSVNGVKITNFAAAGQNVKATAYLTGTTLALSKDELLSNEWIVNGSGTVNGTTLINWQYTVNDGANLISIKATYTKK